jgi:hypothetical protein
MDPAIEKAVSEALAEASDQSEDFKRQFRRLITLVLSGNYEDKDLRNVMEKIYVTPPSDE